MKDFKLRHVVLDVPQIGTRTIVEGRWKGFLGGRFSGEVYEQAEYQVRYRHIESWRDDEGKLWARQFIESGDRSGDRPDCRFNLESGHTQDELRIIRQCLADEWTAPIRHLLDPPDPASPSMTG